jgi:hypothetical protein
MSGYIKNWNFSEIENSIYRAYYVCSDPRQDGYTTWPIKQELYQLKWVLDEVIGKCPNYVDEDQWLTEQEKHRIIKILKSE